MFELSTIWAAIIAFAVLTYVILDGFDLGIGILFPFARTDKDHDVMMNSVAPVWDGNETWLVLGGGGLFAVFPLAFADHATEFYLAIGDDKRAAELARLNLDNRPTKRAPSRIGIT